jgi:hypothetical protein
VAFLKRFGAAVLKGLQIVTGLGPVIAQYVPGAAGTVAIVTSDLAAIADILQQTEVMGQALALPGAQKLKAAAPLVEQIVLKSALLAHHKIADETKFKSAIEGIASNMVDLLNSLEDKVQTDSKT